MRKLTREHASISHLFPERVGYQFIYVKYLTFSVDIF